MPRGIANGSELLCRMPVLNLPDNFNEQLAHSKSGTIDNREGPGVAVYWATDRTARADIYIGLKLDGLKRYENISSVDPSIKMQFVLPLVVSCKPGELDFDPNEDKLISIEVSRHL